MRTERYIDLHTHTTFSDGVLTPRALLAKARQYNLSAIAITDHDSVKAHNRETQQKAKREGVELISGVELSTKDTDEMSYHILGLLLRTSHPTLQSILDDLQTRRGEYARDVLEKLEALGYHVPQMIDTDTKEQTITKAYLAQTILHNRLNRTRLLKEFGQMPTQGQFIEATMIRGKAAYVVQQHPLLPEQAVDIIHTAGGLALLAHPTFYLMKGESIDALCKKLQRWNVDGLEAINVQYERSNADCLVDRSDELIQVAKRNNLGISGGSDFHTDDTQEIGKFIDLGFANYPSRRVPYRILNGLRKRLQSKV